MASDVREEGEETGDVTQKSVTTVAPLNQIVKLEHKVAGVYYTHPTSLHPTNPQNAYTKSWID